MHDKQILTDGSDNGDKDDHKDTHEFGKSFGNEEDDKLTMIDLNLNPAKHLTKKMLI